MLSFHHYKRDTTTIQTWPYLTTPTSVVYITKVIPVILTTVITTLRIPKEPWLLMTKMIPQSEESQI